MGRADVIGDGDISGESTEWYPTTMRGFSVDMIMPKACGSVWLRVAFKTTPE